ncbi:MAG: CoA-transferase subunit beta [Thermoleophilia bacterium]
MRDRTYSPGELMVCTAAREIRDGEVVFVGMRLPMLAFCVAKELHAPRAVGYFELGIVRETPPAEMLYTMGDPMNLQGAGWATQTAYLMGLLASGHVDVGFIGGAQIDRYGNLNTSLVRNGDETVRLPGSGGAADIASLARRLVLIMPHEKRRFVERVDYVTSPGYGEGRGWRERVGLPRGGPSAVITTLGLLRFYETGEAYLHSYHPFSTRDEVVAETGWELAVAPDVAPTPAPSEEELATIRRYDPDGFWTR